MAVQQTLKRATDYVAVARDAARLRRADEDQLRRQVRSHLIARLGKMRGLPQKLGQMLSFSQPSDDEGAAGQYAVLQECADPLPLATVRPVMEAAWSRDLESVLSDIDPRAHAASLGQVHRAMTRDGRDVAVKVQYPGIRDAVMADLKLLGWLSVPLGNLRSGFDLSAYRQTILKDLEQELDYRQEANRQRSFARWAEKDRRLIVPHVIDDLSTDRVLVTEWQEGDHWDVVRETWNRNQKRKLANGLLEFFLTGLFLKRMMQADWHPGNFRFRRTGDAVQVLLYDFGCVYHPSDDQRLSLGRLIKATMDRTESPWPLFLKLGFQREYLEPLSAKLPALCRVLFDPFCCEHPYDLGDWKLDERVSDILGDDRWNFRIAGPADLIFLMRAFHGLKYYLQGLDTPIFWQRAVQPCLESLAVPMRQMKLEDKVADCDYSSLARYLKIRVRREGVTKVELTQYAASIDNLDALLDDDLKQRIRVAGIDLSEVVSNVRRRGYTPGPVFELADGKKDIKVWLE